MKKTLFFAFAALCMLACTGQNGPEEPTKKTTTEGELAGDFSVSASKKVHFSQGNLQYQASTDTWRFAKYQYEACGAANEYASSTYSGWIDTYGWGASGYNNRHPYMEFDLGSGDSEKDTLSYDITGTNYDWGIYNKISNGGNQANLWRTLTGDEWFYLLRERKNADYLFGLATVNGVFGLIILPDNWETPSGLIFTPSITKGLIWEENYEFAEYGRIFREYVNNSVTWEHLREPNNFNDNIYDIAEWTKMESAGAIFLPAGDILHGGDYNYYYGSYWSSTFHETVGHCGIVMMFVNYLVSPNYDGVIKSSVRLVRDVK